MVACVADAAPGGPLIRKLLLDRIEQSAIHDRSLLARQNLTLVADLTDIEPVAQEIEQRSPLKWNATAGAASRKRPDPGAKVTLPEISNQSVDPTELEIAPKDQSDMFSFLFHDDDLEILPFFNRRGAFGEIAADVS
jgi:hypothetical protein